MTLTRPRGMIALGILLLLPVASVPASPHAEPGSTRPTTTAPAGRPVADGTPVPTDPAILRAIVMLGAGDFDAREKAAAFLWSLGDRAMPALREATTGDDPEVARRARSILENSAFGIRPNTPPIVLELLGAYRAGPDEQRQLAMRGLSDQGAAGARVLMKLHADERDDVGRRGLLRVLTAMSRPASAQLLGESDFQGARQLLSMVSAENESAVRDWATFLLLHGGLDDEIKRLRAVVAAPRDPVAAVAEIPLSVRLSHLYRIKGDLPAALGAASGGDALPNAGVIEGIMTEMGDWKTLALRLDQRGVAPGSIEDLGYMTAWNRLAGNAAAADKWANELGSYARDNPPGHWHAAEALLLNDRADEAIAVMRESSNFTAAIQFLNPRLQIREANEELAKAVKAGPVDLQRVKAKAVSTLHFMGKYEEAREIVESIMRGEGGVPDFATYMMTIEAARTIGESPEQVDAWLMTALEDAKPFDDVAKLFDHAGFDRPEQAAQWWQLVRDPRTGIPRPMRIGKLHALDRNEISDADLRELAAAVERQATQLPEAEQDERTMLIAQAMADTGHADLATALLEKLASQSPTAQGLVRLADLYVQSRQWGKAADVYGRAYDRDHGQAAPLLLRGRALIEAGMPDEGRALVEAAHDMPLADETARHSLMESLMKRGLNEDAARERDLILTTGEFGSWERGDALRRSAEAASSQGKHADAARMWDRAFLNNLGTRVSFVEPTANLMIPVMIHRVRAQADIQAGRIDQALQQAKVCLDACAGDADSQIAIVNDLDSSGRKSEADQVYGAARAIYAKLTGDYPKSAPAHNLTAWLQAKCRRDLDEALAHARAAVSFEPENAAILDTLAEVHFQRGEFDAAMELVGKCLKLEPASEHHKKNLQRFTAAKAKAR